MTDENDISKAEIGSQIVRYSGCEIIYGRIKAKSPRGASLTVEWATGRTTKLHHRNYGNVTLADHRQTRRKNDL
jgi:hypothetical protein